MVLGLKEGKNIGKTNKREEYLKERKIHIYKHNVLLTCQRNLSAEKLI